MTEKVISRVSGGQLGARGSHVACYRALSGPQKHQDKSSNLKFPPTYHSKP